MFLENCMSLSVPFNNAFVDHSPLPRGQKWEMGVDGYQDALCPYVSYLFCPLGKQACHSFSRSLEHVTVFLLL